MRKGKRNLWGMVAILLFPYMLCMLLTETGMINRNKETKQKREIRLSEKKVLGAEEYLMAVVSNQIPLEYPLEAIKAQAVLARTWLYEVLEEKEEVLEEELGMGINILQLEQGKAMEQYRKLYQAVTETEGETLWYGTERIIPLYHAVSSGQTRTDISGACPYLIGRGCPNDQESPMFLQVFLKEPSAFEQNFQEAVWEWEEGGYVKTVQVGDQILTGAMLKDIAGVESFAIEMDSYGAYIRIMTRGKGHGYGMSQWQAKAFAEKGYSYEEILSYFFQNVALKKE